MDSTRESGSKYLCLRSAEAFQENFGLKLQDTFVEFKTTGRVAFLPPNNTSGLEKSGQ